MQQEAAMATPQPPKIGDHLPLRLLKSESIPPAPNPSHSGSTFDFLPDFASFSWIAYGASSLLLISPFPSPSSSLSPPDASSAPFSRQSFDLSSGDVSSVSWSLAPAASLTGDLAASAGNRIFLFEYNLSPGSFCWSQSAVLVQSVKVDAIKWTGSGDGIIAGGMDVVLWKRGSISWEIAWKYEMKQAQSLVSTTWFIGGLSATCTYSGTSHDEGSSPVLSDGGRYAVNMFESEDKSGHFVELWHPQPVLMIQWRPSRAGDIKKHAINSWSNILITSCLDGTVRFWGEIRDGRINKNSKDVSDSKVFRQSFYVVALIEINQTLNGTLGTDIFVNWALESGGIVHTGEGPKLFPPQQSQNDKAGRCEWLVALGPGTMLTFWAVHCLDDIAPMRCPRLSLWKRQKLPVTAVKHASDTNLVNLIGKSNFRKVFVFRNQLSSPPLVCSIVHVLPCNTLGLSVLCSGKLAYKEDPSTNKYENANSLLLDAHRILNIDGHTGKVLQVAVRPSCSEADLAASLDSNGLLLLWSLPLSSSFISGLPSLNSSWMLLGNVSLQDVATNYKSIAWAPSWLDGEWVLLLGHDQGIDCCIINTDRNEEGNILFHKLCTIPFNDRVLLDGPDKIFSIPLRPTCIEAFNYSSFILIGTWSMGFQALSWKITLHSFDLTGSCSICDSDIKDNPGCSRFMYENSLSGKRYCIILNPSSKILPDCYLDNQVTSFDVVRPSIMMPSSPWQFQEPTNDSSANFVTYDMVTGHSDGTVRLWKSNLSESSAENVPWELVGMFVAHQGAVSAISVADCGQKVATSSSTSNSNSEHKLSLWEPVNLAGVGCFLLEEEIILSKYCRAFSWLPVGNGKLVLGVCFEKELHVYAQRRHSGSSLLNLANPSDSSIWFCISIACSSSTISEFLWGPCATLILIHEKFFSLYGPCTTLMNGNKVIKSGETKQDMLHFNNKREKGAISLIHADYRFHGSEDQLLDAVGGESQSSERIQTSKGLYVQIGHENFDMQTEIGFLSILEVTEHLCSPLPLYHPEALLTNIHSGNWKRACATLYHVVNSLASSSFFKQNSEPAHPPGIITQIKLSNYFEGLSSSSGTNKGFQWASDATLVTASSDYDGGFIHASQDSLSSASKSELNEFLQILDKSNNLLLTDTEKMQTFAIVELLKEISNSQSASVYEGLDDLGRRFWCSVRLQQLICLRRLGRIPSTAELNINSRMIAWAFHSDCQDNLFNAVLPTEPSWDDMQNMGFGYWFTNAAQLRVKMEKLARSQYLKSKDPKACTLLYTALNRLQVLAGLFKISKDEKNKAMIGFLSRNFQEEKHKAAALKNAYVLMGKHQLELAIAFFLLGGDPISAVNVCAKTLGNEQLALVICRLVDGKGGTLEQHLISKVILPSAIEKEDYWLSSVLEWSLGNYCQALLGILGFKNDASVDGASNTLKHVALLDPSIGQFCQKMVSSNSLRNAVGEKNSTILLQWATIVTTAAFNKCGLPLEALECLSSSSSNPVILTQGTHGESSNILPRVLRPTSVNSFNWLAAKVVSHLETLIKSDLAMQYISKLLWENSSFSNTKCASNEGSALSHKSEVHHYKSSLKELQENLNLAITYLQGKFTLIPRQLLDKILFSLSNHGLVLVGNHILNGLFSKEFLHSSNHFASIQISPSPLYKLHGAARDLAKFLPQFVSACSMASLQPNIAKYMNEPPMKESWGQFVDLWFYMQGFISSLNHVKASLCMLGNGNADHLKSIGFSILDLCKYCAYLAFSIQRRDHQAIVLLLQPVMISHTEENCSRIDMTSVDEILTQVSKHMDQLICANRCQDLRGSQSLFHGSSRNTSAVPGDAWDIAGACLWEHVSHSILNGLNDLCEELRMSSALCGYVDDISIVEHIQLVSITFAKSIRNTMTHTLSYYTQQLAFFMWKNVEAGMPLPNPLWLEEFMKSQSRDSHMETNRGAHVLAIDSSEVPSSRAELFLSMCFEHAQVSQLLAASGFDLSQFARQKPFCGWTNLHLAFGRTQEVDSAQLTQEVVQSVASSCNQIKLDAESQPQFEHHLRDIERWVGATSNPHPFKSPKEIYRKNGELLEALCVNSIDQRQATLAIDRKGIVFFNWDDGSRLCDQSEYIWSEADWPHNGWADTESTPVPVVGLGSRKGSRLGMGGATVGLGSVTRPMNDLTGGGAFGIPGYAGIGASGLGWEIQEDFEKFIDPPATVENVSTRALSAHPSRDFFLVGSRNTHIYLWKFGKDKATATYGVLPAAIVPPPYALASVTSLKFDGCGQRFANAASDGTVRTWQLEVGGRSNVKPTESSICFSGHASEISYVSTSGSIIAAAGYSSNGVNVVVWDTLAPPTTSRASVMCHEGGASSIAVFDNDVGSGSISPFIVTGGKGGDVGLHDFRYIATGKTKRHKHPNVAEQMSDTSFAESRPLSNMGDHNRNGMLWYIPNAHSGSIAKISTIPNTCLFLTGSRDGEVKLWDAKNFKLVFHWSKLHERHTFLQRSSSGFGSVTRVALTDIQVVSGGFLSCGGDGSVKFTQLGDFT